MTEEPRYTAHDPQFEITCESCSFRRHNCAGTITIPEGHVVPAGEYKCACALKCRLKKKVTS